MKWPAWAVVQSQRYCVFINPIELYWIATVSKYVNVGCVTFRSFCIIIKLTAWVLKDPPLPTSLKYTQYLWVTEKLIYCIICSRYNVALLNRLFEKKNKFYRQSLRHCCDLSSVTGTCVYAIVCFPFCMLQHIHSYHITKYEAVMVCVDSVICIPLKLPVRLLDIIIMMTASWKWSHSKLHALVKTCCFTELWIS
jgi:hypothetical protein